MKTLSLFSLLLFFISGNGQERKFQINFGSDTGYSKLKMNEETIDASTSGGFLHLQYGVSSFFSIESGVNYFQTQGDYVLDGDSYFVENQAIKIPVGLRTKIGFGRNDEDISQQRFTVMIGAGLNTNYAMRLKIENLYKNSNLGWNFGLYTKAGVHIQANEVFSLGAGIMGEKDFSEIKKNDQSIQENRNTVFIDFGIRL